jgi:hypothetical protein
MSKYALALKNKRKDFQIANELEIGFNKIFKQKFNY